MESRRVPYAGDIIISVNAAEAAIVDSVDEARSDPISAIRAGAGENATKVEDKRVRNDDDCKTAKLLAVEDGNVDAGRETDGGSGCIVD